MIFIYTVKLNTGRFANESVRQRPVRQRMKSIRQRQMSVRQRLYASYFGSQGPTMTVNSVLNQLQNTGPLFKSFALIKCFKNG